MTIKIPCQIGIDVGDGSGDQTTVSVVSGNHLGFVKSIKDRREIRNFARFLRLKEKYWKKMLTRPRWIAYLGLSPEEAAACLKRENNPICQCKKPAIVTDETWCFGCGKATPITLTAKYQKGK